MDPWKLPLTVAGVTVPIVAAFMLGGPGVGVAIWCVAAGPATQAMPVGGEGDNVGAAVGGLRSRLRAEFHHVRLSRSGAERRS